MTPAVHLPPWLKMTPAVHLPPWLKMTPAVHLAFWLKMTPAVHLPPWFIMTPAIHLSPLVENDTHSPFAPLVKHDTRSPLAPLGSKWHPQFICPLGCWRLSNWSYSQLQVGRNQHWLWIPLLISGIVKLFCVCSTIDTAYNNERWEKSVLSCFVFVRLLILPTTMNARRNLC